MNEEHLEILESYLVSGGTTNNTDLIQRYAFQCCDKATKADYKIMKQKLEEEGEQVQGI